jgi:hypothetical protein
MRAPIRGLVITGLLTARFGLCHGQVAEFLPTDQGPTDSAFKAFRTSLRRAVSQFDTGFVMSVLSPEVTTGFDSPAGPEAFHKTWFERSPSPNLWEVLGTILGLGGAFHSDSVFMAPYVTATWPGRCDSFEHVAVVGRQVRVRRRPSHEARVLATVSYQILRVRGYAQSGRKRWQGELDPRVPSGRSGGVRCSVLCSEPHRLSGSVHQARRALASLLDWHW